jgi:DNA-binding NarL/FixJ family response regulator
MTPGNKRAKTVRVVIVDDHPIVRHGLTQLIQTEADLEVVGEAAEAGEAMQLVEATNPDLVVLDISLRGTNGIELIKQIRARNSTIKLLVSSMHDESLYAERALRAGAMGYIKKEVVTDQIIAAIRTLLGGKIYLSDHITDRILHRVVAGQEELGGSMVDGLSDRELEVFELIGQGLGTRQIAKQLHLSVKTIETYREHIKAKLNIHTASELAQHAVQWALEH